MSTRLAQLLMVQRKNLESQAREITDLAETESRELTAEENVKFDRITADMTALRAQADRLVEFAADSLAADEALRNAGHSGAPQGDVDLSDQFRRLASGEIRSMNLVATREEARALGKATATAGGNTVKTTFIEDLYQHLIETATLLRGGATIWNTTSGENIDVPITTAHGTAALVAEAGTIPQADPAFGKRTLGAFKYGDLILVPSELLDDTSVDLKGYLAKQAGRAVGNSLGTDLVVGNGTAKPAGIFNSSTLGVTSGTGVAGVPTFDNLIDLQYSVIGPYRANGSWLMKDNTAGALRKIKDTTNQYIWENSVIAGTPDTILGKPVLTDYNVAATGVNNKSVLFGDLSAYVVRLVNNIRWERSDDFKFDTDVVAFRCLIRGDGLLIDQTGAVKHFVGAAT